MLRSDEIRQERTLVGDRMATEVELAAYSEAWPRYEAAADALLAAKDDVSLAEVTRQLPDDPWAATVEAWEGPVICAADADTFSARDWRRNVLGSGNLLPDGGVGVRNSRDSEGLVLQFTPDEWHAFLGGVRNGEFDSFGRK